jgi:hypothetical protein
MTVSDLSRHLMEHFNQEPVENQWSTQFHEIIRVNETEALRIYPIDQADQGLQIMPRVDGHFFVGYGNFTLPPKNWPEDRVSEWRRPFDPLDVWFELTPEEVLEIVREFASPTGDGCQWPIVPNWCALQED